MMIWSASVVLAPDKYSTDFLCPKEAGRTVWKLTHLHFHYYINVFLTIHSVCSLANTIATKKTQTGIVFIQPKDRDGVRLLFFME